MLFGVIALDVTTSCPPNKLAAVNVPFMGTFTRDLLDVDALGAGPEYWAGGGAIGSSAWWGLCQSTFSGGGAVGSPTFSSSCWTVQTSGAFTVTPVPPPPALQCVVNLQWSEDMAGSVMIQAN